MGESVTNFPLCQALIPWSCVFMPKDDNSSTMAVFFDLENIVIGVREANYPKFDIKSVMQRLLTKGHIVVKKAYCEWGYNRPDH